MADDGTSPFDSSSWADLQQENARAIRLAYSTKKNPKTPDRRFARRNRVLHDPPVAMSAARESEEKSSSKDGDPTEAEQISDKMLTTSKTPTTRLQSDENKHRAEVANGTEEDGPSDSFSNLPQQDSSKESVPGVHQQQTEDSPLNSDEFTTAETLMNMSHRNTEQIDQPYSPVINPAETEVSANKAQSNTSPSSEDESLRDLLNLIPQAILDRESNDDGSHSAGTVMASAFSYLVDLRFQILRVQGKVAKDRDGKMQKESDTLTKAYQRVKSQATNLSQILHAKDEELTASRKDFREADAQLQAVTEQRNQAAHHLKQVEKKAIMHEEANKRHVRTEADLKAQITQYKERQIELKAHIRNAAVQNAATTRDLTALQASSEQLRCQLAQMIDERNAFQREHDAALTQEWHLRHHIQGLEKEVESLEKEREFWLGTLKVTSDQAKNAQHQRGPWRIQQETRPAPQQSLGIPRQRADALYSQDQHDIGLSPFFAPSAGPFGVHNRGRRIPLQDLTADDRTATMQNIGPAPVRPLPPQPPIRFLSPLRPLPRVADDRTETALNTRPALCRPFRRSPAQPSKRALSPGASDEAAAAKKHQA